MRVPRASAARTAALIGVTLAAGACAYALGLKPGTGSTASTPGAQAPSSAAALARPPVEAVANRDSALALLPRDSAGNLDWEAAVHSGAIRPRAAAPGRDSGATVAFDFDTYLSSKPKTLEAYFPHSSHNLWLTCQNCHPAIFRTARDTLTMEAIDAGGQCGVCHARVAFSSSACERCHPELGEEEEAGEPEPPTLRDDRPIARLADTAIARRGRSYPPAIFSHAVHRIRYRCSACHDALFAMRTGAGSVRMADMDGGRSCGACHDGAAAFALIRCQQCHVAAAPRSRS